MEDADVIVVAYGASSRVARSAVNKAREAGMKVGLIRPITLWPFPKDAMRSARQTTPKSCLAVEMSMGQMVDDVRLAAECTRAGALLRPHRRRDPYPGGSAGRDR